jgi:hypothetical protein
MPPVISNLVYTVTDTTIVATWTTDTSSDSNLSAGGKAAVDNGLAANSTSHQAIVAGLAPSTLYSCIVTSGGTSSSPQNVTTSVAHSTTPITVVGFGTDHVTTADGDITYNFLSNDNITYMMRDDAKTPPGGAGFNQQMDTVTNESTLALSLVNGMSAYGAYATENGTDGPAGHTLSNKGNGLFGMAGSLFWFTGRHYIVGSSRQQYYGNVIRSDDHGATWSNFSAPTTFNANGVPYYPNSGSNSIAPFFFGADSTFGWVTPVRYAGDDGTLGYNTAGNGFSGGNAYVYFAILNGPNDAANNIYLGRIPRISLFSLDRTAEQFWIGPTSPTDADFVNDANWQSASTGLTSIYTPATTTVGWPDICFIPTINRYLLFSTYRPSTASTSNTIWRVLEGPTPAGPWTLVGTIQNSPSGWYCQTILHRTAASNVLTDNIPLTVVYSGDFNNQIPYYHPTYSTLTVSTSPQSPVTNVFVQAKGTTAAQSGTTGTLAYTSNVTSGNLLVTSWRYNGSGAVHLTSVTSTRTTGNWTIVYDQSDGAATPIQGGWAYAWATSTGACTVTLNFNTSVVGIDICVGEWNGPTTVRTTSAPRINVSQNIPFSSSIPVQGGDLLIGVVTLGAASSQTLSAGSGYVQRAHAITGGVTDFTAIEDNLNATLGFSTATFNVIPSGGGISSTVGIGAFYSQGIISGNAGVSGATVAWTSVSSGSGSTTSDGSGNYSTSSLASDVYTITPTKTGYSFTPTSVQQVMISANVNGVNFTATHLPVSTPSISPNGGNFDSPQTVTVSDTDSGLAGFAMYYTTDGTTPTTGSTLYTAPIAVTTSLTLKVLAVATGFLNSAVASATFNIVRGGGGLGYRFTYGF